MPCPQCGYFEAYDVSPGVATLVKATRALIVTCDDEGYSDEDIVRAYARVSKALAPFDEAVIS